MSSSSAASSSSSRSASPEVAEASSSSAPTQRLQTNTANTSRYIPPLNYQYAQFPASSGRDFKDLRAPAQTGSSSKAPSQGKQVWIIKIPDGVDPSQLDGLKVSLPDRTASDKPLATLTNKRKEANGSVKDVYQLFGASAAAKHDLPSDARNTQSGLKKSKAKRDGEKSQLVDEAEGQERSDGKEGYAGHMSGIRAYMPVAGSKEGLITAASVPIAQHLEFVMAPPAIKNEESSSSAKSQGKQKTATKLRELSGYFAPAGSLYDEDVASKASLPSSPRETQSTSAPTASEKKRKSAEINPDESQEGSSKKKGKTEKEKKDKDAKGASSPKKEKKRRDKDVKA